MSIDWNKPLRRKGDKVAVAAWRERSLLYDPFTKGVLFEDGCFGTYTDNGQLYAGIINAADLENAPTEKAEWVVIAATEHGHLLFQSYHSEIEAITAAQNRRFRVVFGPHRIAWEE